MIEYNIYPEVLAMLFLSCFVSGVIFPERFTLCVECFSTLFSHYIQTLYK